MGIDDGTDDSTDSNNDISNDGNDSTDDVNSDDDNDSDDDDCIGREQDDCDEQTDDNGDVECAFNIVENTCKSYVRREGRYGSGNFDDGYIAAKDQAAKESSELTTLIGILGGIIGALILIIAGGGYYFYRQMNFNNKGKAISGIDGDGQSTNIDNDEHMVMGINTEAPVKANDTDPMLS